jgi:hypothetical protein
MEEGTLRLRDLNQKAEIAIQDMEKGNKLINGRK